MTNFASNPDPHGLGDGALPPELAALAADLDRLAAAEASSAGPTLEDRVLLRTRAAATHEGMTPEVRRVNQGLAGLAAEELAASPAGLEERVFQATVGTLRAPAAAGVIGRGSGWGRRLALAAGLLLAAGAGYVVLSRTSGTADKTAPGGTLANNSVPKAETPGAEAPSVKVAADDLERYVTTTDAEASFAALFAMNVDSLDSDIRTATQEAARLDKALSAEPAADTTTSGG